MYNAEVTGEVDLIFVIGVLGQQFENCLLGSNVAENFDDIANGCGVVLIRDLAHNVLHLVWLMTMFQLVIAKPKDQDM
ncbi:hypothetical protein D3C71_2004440 [compost metagenome]